MPELLTNFFLINNEFYLGGFIVFIRFYVYLLTYVENKGLSRTDVCRFLCLFACLFVCMYFWSGEESHVRRPGMLVGKFKLKPF